MRRCAQSAPVSLKRIGLNRLALGRPMGIVLADARPERAECLNQRPSQLCPSSLRCGESSAVERSGRIRSARRPAWPKIGAKATARLDETSQFDLASRAQLNGHDESQAHWRPFSFGRISLMRMCPIAQTGHSVRDLPVSVS